MSGRCKRFGELFGNCCSVIAIITLVSAYVCLIVFSGLAVQTYKKLDEDDRCDLSPTSFGSLFTAIYFGITFHIMLRISYTMGSANNECKKYDGYVFKFVCGILHVVCGSVLAAYTIFDSCFQSEYYGSYVFDTCCAMFALNILITIPMIVDTIYLKDAAGTDDLSFTVVMCVFAIIVMGFILLVVTAVMSGMRYKGDYDYGRKHDSEHNCALTPVGLGLLFTLALCLNTIIGVSLFFASVSTDGILLQSKTTKYDREGIMRHSAFTIFCAILTVGIVMIIYNFSYYTWHSDCFTSKYEGTLVLNTIIAVIIYVSINAVFCFCATIHNISMLLAHICYPSYNYVLNGDETSNAQINKQQLPANADIVSTFGSPIIPVVCNTNNCVAIV